MQLYYLKTWVGLFLMLLISISMAQAPKLINYQGKLAKNDDGTFVNGTKAIEFSIYPDKATKNSIWEETQVVTVINGIFNVLLGSNSPFDDKVFMGKGERWLGIKVDNEEVTPRFQMTSVPFALNALFSTVEYQYSASDSWSNTTVTPGNPFYDTDVWITVKSDQLSSYLVQACCNVGHNMNNMVVDVGIFRDETELVFHRQRVNYPYPFSCDESISFFTVDVPPIGEHIYRLRFRALDQGTGYIVYKRLFAMKLN